MSKRTLGCLCTCALLLAAGGLSFVTAGAASLDVSAIPAVDSIESPPVVSFLETHAGSEIGIEESVSAGEEGACCREGECSMESEEECVGGCVRDPAPLCDGDTDGDGQVNPVDAGLIQAAFGSRERRHLCQYDVDCDGQINPVDAGIVQSLFGTCNRPRPASAPTAGSACATRRRAPPSPGPTRDRSVA